MYSFVFCLDSSVVVDSIKIDSTAYFTRLRVISSCFVSSISRVDISIKIIASASIAHAITEGTEAFEKKIYMPIKYPDILIIAFNK